MSGARTRRAARGVAIALCLFAASSSAQPRRPKPKPKPKPPELPVQPVQPATSIAVTVIEVAGTQAYLQPGASGGVHRGANVVINQKQYAVVQTTSAYAVIDVSKDPVREHDKGQASIVDEEDERPAELAKPRPLATFQGAWTEADAPATAQTPRYVPLGGSERDRRWDVRLAVAAGALIPLGRGAAISRAEVNARVHAEPFQAPLAFDLDASVQRWFASDLDGRAGADARPLVWLREALVGYGAPGGFYAGLGRMRYAASTLGTLDGTRLRAPLGAGFAVGAFGGVLPNPLSGEPSLVAQRFGVETTYSRPDLDVRPEAAVVVHGSTFGGGLDERRLSGVFGLYPGLSRFGGHFEVSGFDKNNPWNASPIELTAAGLDGSLRFGIFQLGGRFDLRQPIRSRWLASFLPTAWFCRTVPLPAGAPPGPEPCDGSVSTRALGAVDAGVEVGDVRLTVGATTIGDLTQKDGAPDMKGGFASGRVVRIAKVLRVDASASYSQATYLDMLGGSAGPGASLFGDVLDVSAYYRYATLRYRSLDSAFVQHGAGGTAMLFPTGEVLFTVQGEAITGDDVKAVVLFGTAMWRPRF